MLWYNEDQVLEPFKNTLLIRYYDLLFDVQNLRKVGKQLAGQSSTPYMWLEMHSSIKWNFVKFDEFKL